MLKTLLLINELTCSIGKEISLVFIYCVSVLRERAIPLTVTGCVSALPYARVCAHYSARYLTVTVKILTLESIFPVALAGSLVWWDSP